jgi:hypothetical protein
MAGLRNDQVALTLDTIYNLEDIYKEYSFTAKNVFILATDGTGTVDVYTSEETPSAKTDMHLEHENISGHKVFSTIPNYIYITENTSTVDSVILTGIEATEVT